MSITKVIAQKAKYDAEMVTKFPPPISRAQIISEFMEEVIEVLTEHEKLLRKIKPKQKSLKENKTNEDIE